MSKQDFKYQKTSIKIGNKVNLTIKSIKTSNKSNIKLNNILYILIFILLSVYLHQTNSLHIEVIETAVVIFDFINIFSLF